MTGPQSPPDDYSKQRYLTAKRSVDDRALDPTVFDAATSFVNRRTPPADILEVAAGVGTMLERLLDWDVLPAEVEYTALDLDPANVTAARDRLPDIAQAAGYEVEQDTGSASPAVGASTEPTFHMRLTRGDRVVHLTYLTADAFAFAEQMAGSRTWDLLVAGAFIDLVPGVDSLRSLFRLVPDGGFYAPITFDGATRFVPVVDDEFDPLLERRFHERMRTGDDPTDPRAGSRLPTWVRRAGGDVEALGGSDWIVRPTGAGYPADEAYFLYHVLTFVDDALGGDPELDGDRLRRWLRRRREQIADGTLVYIAHNLDLFATVAATDGP